MLLGKFLILKACWKFSDKSSAIFIEVFRESDLYQKFDHLHLTLGLTGPELSPVYLFYAPFS